MRVLVCGVGRGVRKLGGLGVLIPDPEVSITRVAVRSRSSITFSCSWHLDEILALPVGASCFLGCPLPTAQ